MNLLKNFALIMFGTSVGLFLLFFAWPKKQAEVQHKNTILREGQSLVKLKEEIKEEKEFAYEFKDHGYSVIERGIVLQNKNESKKYQKLKKLLGWLPPENSVIRMQKRLGNKTLFDKVYTTKELGQRITEQEKGTKHLIIIGGSNTFGIGVNDDETLPYYLARETSQFTVYNFGVEGFSPSHFPLYIKNTNLKSRVFEESGTLVFYFFPFLVKRVTGGIEYLLSIKGASPEYRLVNKELTYKGAFKESLRYKLFHLLSNSQLLVNAITKTQSIGTEELLLVREVFSEIKKEYLKNYPDGKFLVYLPNVYGWKFIRWRKEFLKLLLESSISFYESDNSDQKELYYEEGHLTPKGHLILARELIESNML